MIMIIGIIKICRIRKRRICKRSVIFILITEWCICIIKVINIRLYFLISVIRNIIIIVLKREFFNVSSFFFIAIYYVISYIIIIFVIVIVIYT